MRLMTMKAVFRLDWAGFSGRLLLTLAFLLPGVALLARVYLQPDAALAEAFPDADLEKIRVYLSETQARTIEEQTGAVNLSRFYTFYRAAQNGRTIGYAVFDTHRVRTKDETLLISINPDGTLRGIRVISFFEPEEYLPPERWLNLLGGKTGMDSLAPGADLPVISGATLTSRSVARSARVALLVHRLRFL